MDRLKAGLRTGFYKYYNASMIAYSPYPPAGRLGVVCSYLGLVCNEGIKEQQSWAAIC